MTGFNTQLSAECISLLNLVMALSSLVQFIISVQSSRWLCWKWSVPNWASQRRQRQGTKTPSVTEWRKNLGRNQAQSGGQFPSGQTISSLFQLQQSQSVSGPLLPGVFPRWMSRWRGPHWRSVSGAHLCVLDSADVQGCRGRLQVLILHLWQTLVKSVCEGDVLHCVRKMVQMVITQDTD